jgi:hypothetical protein
LEAENEVHTLRYRGDRDEIIEIGEELFGFKLGTAEAIEFWRKSGALKCQH